MNTTGKVLIGVGVGCGGLILLSLVGVMAAGFWVKGKVDGVMAEAEVMKKQEDRAAALDAKLRFANPLEAEPVALTKERFEAYLGIRTAVEAAGAKYEAALSRVSEAGEAGEVGDGAGAKKRDVTFDELTAAGSAMIDKMRDQREAFLKGCEEQGMSPAEFHAITETVRATKLGVEVLDENIDRRAMVELSLSNAEEQVNDKSLPKAMRDRALKDVKRYKDELAALPPPRAPSEAAKAQNEANRELLAAHFGERVPDEGFTDVFLPGLANKAAKTRPAPTAFGVPADPATDAEPTEVPEPAQAGVE